MKYRNASTEEVELFLTYFPELAWDDFMEVVPGQWQPRPESHDKIMAVREDAKQRLAEIEAEEARVNAELEVHRRKVAESWYPARFLPMNEPWIDKDTRE